MSLYLAIFDGDEEMNGWVLGHYSDFAYFRDAIAAKLPGDAHPTLMTHPPCAGEWSPDQLSLLREELTIISEHFKKLPVEHPQGAFEHTARFREEAKSLYDCFHNVDGENLFEALIALCDDAMFSNQPIVFQ